MPEQAGHLVNGAIRLESDHVPNDDVEWYGGLFQEMWARVPERYRQQLESYWTGRVAPPGCQKSPFYKDRYDSRLILYRDDGLPGVNHGGHLVFMPLGSLKAMPRKLAVFAVAHELVHVSHHAEGESQHWRLNGAGPANYNASERLVDARLLEWGFSQERHRYDGRVAG